MITQFQLDVHDVLVGLRPGQVVSYGWVAEESGHPSAAQAVGGYLRTHPDPPNWWRVVATDGALIAPEADEQAHRLRAEGHVVVHGKLRTAPARPRGR